MAPQSLEFNNPSKHILPFHFNLIYFQLPGVELKEPKIMDFILTFFNNFLKGFFYYFHFKDFIFLMFSCVWEEILCFWMTGDFEGFREEEIAIFLMESWRKIGFKKKHRHIAQNVKINF
jgi:hypothetical protein